MDKISRPSPVKYPELRRPLTLISWVKHSKFNIILTITNLPANIKINDQMWLVIWPLPI